MGKHEGPREQGDPSAHRANGTYEQQNAEDKAKSFDNQHKESSHRTALKHGNEDYTA